MPYQGIPALFLKFKATKGNVPSLPYGGRILKTGNQGNITLFKQIVLLEKHSL